MRHPKSLKSDIILNEFLKVTKERLEFPSGYEHDHFTLSLPTPSSISVVAATTGHRLIINEEYRHPTRQTVLSLPGGFLHEDETPLEGARRELLEETGYDSIDLEEIGASYPMPGICDQKVIYVLADRCIKKKDPELEGGEIIRAVLLSPDEIAQRVSEGQAVDGILLAGLWHYHNRRDS